MSSDRVLCGCALALLSILAGCGGSSFSPSDVTVTVAPATATVAINGQVQLLATVHNNCSGCTPFYNWTISENNGVNCTFVDGPMPTPCPGGTLQQPSATAGSTVTYIAPNTSGTFHVNGQSLYYSNLGPPTTTAQGTSVVTVTP